MLNSHLVLGSLPRSSAWGRQAQPIPERGSKWPSSLATMAATMWESRRESVPKGRAGGVSPLSSIHADRGLTPPARPERTFWNMPNHDLRVEDRGLEPLTSCMPCKRSPS